MRVRFPPPAPSPFRIFPYSIKEFLAISPPRPRHCLSWNLTPFHYLTVPRFVPQNAPRWQRMDDRRRRPSNIRRQAIVARRRHRACAGQKNDSRPGAPGRPNLAERGSGGGAPLADKGWCRGGADLRVFLHSGLNFSFPLPGSGRRKIVRRLCSAHGGRSYRCCGLTQIVHACQLGCPVGVARGRNFHRIADSDLGRTLDRGQRSAWDFDSR